MAEQNQQLQGEEYSDEQLLASLERSVVYLVLRDSEIVEAPSIHRQIEKGISDKIDNSRQKVQAAKNNIPQYIEPMKPHGYPRDIIDKFANEMVQLADDFSPEKADKIRRIYADIVANLPPWQQALVIEGNRPIVFGRYSTINALYKEKGGAKESNIDGFFQPKENQVYVSIGFFGSHYGVANTTWHEKGHQFDWMKELVGSGKFYSDNSDSWKNALAREQNNWQFVMQHGGEEILKEIAPRYNVSKLLSAYTPEKFPHEAMAEMTAVYNKAYVKYGGDVGKVNALMENAYPDLFPVYRDEFIPHCMAKVKAMRAEHLTQEKLSNPENVLVSYDAERNLAYSEIKEVDFPNSDGATNSKRKGIEAVTFLHDRDVGDAKAVLKQHGINATFFESGEPEYRQYLLFDNDADAKKFEDLRKSGNLLKHQPHADTPLARPTPTPPPSDTKTAALLFGRDGVDAKLAAELLQKSGWEQNNLSGAMGEKAKALDLSSITPFDRLDIYKLQEDIGAAHLRIMQDGNKSYLVVRDMEQFSELVAKANGIPVRSLPAITSTVKSLATFLPTNLDNIAMAGVASAGTTLYNLYKGYGTYESFESGKEVFSEASGFASVGRSYNASSNGNLQEAAIQAADALGMPIPALMEAIKASWQECSPRDFAPHCLAQAKPAKTTDKTTHR